MGFDRVSFIGLGDLRIAYRTAGEPDAPTIVLLHALTATGADWEPVVDALARNHRVIAPDARGHGHSDWATSYSLELLRDDVLGLIEALALDQLTLIGHSFGGTIAATYRPSSLRADLRAISRRMGSSSWRTACRVGGW
jgi:pimeloyl-ACP methyl ester carboxylesterase